MTATALRMETAMDRLDGWTEIADYLCKSERWCRTWAAESVPKEKRLPVRWLGRMVTASKAQLDEFTNGNPQGAALAELSAVLSSISSRLAAMEETVRRVEAQVAEFVSTAERR